MAVIGLELFCYKVLCGTSAVAGFDLLSSGTSGMSAVKSSTTLVFAI